jgi:hypothetical protein
MHQRKRNNWHIRVEYRDAVVCGAIERNASMSEAIAEIRRVMPWLPKDSVKVQAYEKRRQMVRDGRIAPDHGIVALDRAVSEDRSEWRLAPPEPLLSSQPLPDEVKVPYFRLSDAA